MVSTGSAVAAPQAAPRSAASNFVNRIVLTTKFLVETHETDPTGGGHTALLNMFKPAPSLTPSVLRAVVLADLIRARRLGLGDAAVAFGHWLRSSGLVPAGVAFSDDDVRQACAPHERAARGLDRPMDKIERGFLQAAECFWEMHVSDIGRHSRVPEFVVPLAAVPKGRSRRAPAIKPHPEHVVPLAFIRDRCLELLQARHPRHDPASRDAALPELVAMVRRWLVVVDVSEDERQSLDEGDQAVKDAMPPGWDPATGCLFARLHRFDIEFDMDPTAGPAWRCSCGHPTGKFTSADRSVQA